MSVENEEIVRRAFEAACRQPKPDFVTLNALYHPDHEFVSLIQRIEGGVAMGASGFRDWIAENNESWTNWDLQFDRVESIDTGRVLVATRFAGISRRAEVPVEQSNAVIVTVRDGKIARTVIYDSVEDAVEAAGLPGSPG
jgi:ketosteroid isomerase-like protein